MGFFEVPPCERLTDDQHRPLSISDILRSGRGRIASLYRHLSESLLIETALKLWTAPTRVPLNPESQRNLLGKMIYN
jgi:hypothetical protein